jgi:hypothetical protein
MAVLAGGVLAAAADGAVITTLYATNNNGSPGGAVYFDVTVGSNPIQIDRFEVNTLAAGGSMFGFQAFTRVGTWVGNTSSSAGWTLSATGTGTAAGTDMPSPVALNAPFMLAANTTYGFSLVLADVGGGNSAPHAYTNGTGSNQNFSNADLAVALGGATNTPFGGSPFMPRVWNGSIYYTVVPAPASLALLGLGGLVAGRRRR